MMAICVMNASRLQKPFPNEVTSAAIGMRSAEIAKTIDSNVSRMANTKESGK